MIINKNNLLPLDALLVFIHTAEHLNFTHTARDLGVTQAAISRRIKNLETFLGADLFSRSNKRRLELTGDGNRLFETAKNSLSMLDSVVAEIRQSRRLNSLTVTTTAGFANQWLIRRMTVYNQLYPTASVRLVLVDDDLDLAIEGIDIGIRYGNGEWPDLNSKRLFEEYVYPVCTPDYLAGNAEICKLDGLAKADLLYVEEARPTAANWSKWFDAFGLKPDESHRKIILNDYSSLIQSCLLGQGVLLGWHHMIYDLLDRGELLRPLKEVLRTDIGFYTVWPRDRSLSKNASVFIKWICQEASKQISP